MLIRIDTEKAIADIEARLGMLYEKAPDVMRKSLNDTACLLYTSPSPRDA